MKSRYQLSLMIMMMSLVGVIGHPLAFGYDEVDVENGGTISGRITLGGEIPKPRVFSLIQFPFGPFCKKISDGQGNVRLKEFIVDRKTHGLWEAVVSIRNIKQGKPYRPTVADFVAVDCMFHPSEVADNEMFSVDEAGEMHHEHPNVAIIHNHQRMNMINRDPVVHNIQVYQNEKGNIILNTPLSISDQVRGGVLHYKKGKRISQMICGMHEFMQSWGFVVNNPYYAKTAKDGSYHIDGVPPGTYTVSIWHPHFSVHEQVVTVKTHTVSNLNYELDASEVKRPVYETQEQTRIDTATPEDHMLHEDDERIIMD